MNHWAFWVCLVISISLIIASFCVPPMGIIDGSILAAVGELFGFSALATVIQAIDKGADVTLNHGNTSMQLNNPDNKE